MSCSSVAVEFINTGSKTSRHRMLKSPAELKKLEPGSLDVYCKGNLERYAERPIALENICLADFVACFTFKGKGTIATDEEDIAEEDHFIEEVATEQAPDNSQKTFQTLDGTLTYRRQPKVVRFCRFNVHTDPINFFRERLMLFKPWRKEEEELENIDGEGMYREHRDLIETNSRKHIAVDLDMNEIVKEIENQRASAETENDDTNRPADEEEIVTEFVNVYDFDDNIIHPNVMFEIGQEQASIGEVKRFAIPDQLCDNELYALCDSLNNKQRDYFMHILNAFKLKNVPFYHFISGKAGVGKSRLIKAIFQGIIRLFRSTPGPVETPEVLIVAYTGKVAHNVNGMTAHTAFSLAMVEGNKYSVSKGLGPEALNTLRVKLSNLKLIIIDEISMMGITTFEKINDRLRQVFQPSQNQIFGGRSVIVLGDFNQLKPVKDGFVCEKGRGDIKQLATPLWHNFQMFELTEIMRQKNDIPFAEALSRLATGELTESDTQMFQTRCFTDNNLPNKGKEAIRLFWKNESVRAYNNYRLDQLKITTGEKQITFNAQDSIVCAQSETDRKQALYILKNATIDKTQGVPSSIILHIGIRYMVTSNVDVSDGLFNGATGVLKFIEFANHKAENVFLEFEDESIGKKARADHYKKYKHTTAIQKNWTPISRLKLTFQITKKASVRVCREMYPLVVSEGMTIHKSQGQSMDYVTVQLEKGMDRSLLYVALSRATSLSGLFILGEFKAPNKPDTNHKPEMGRLRANATFVPKFAFLRSIPSDVIQIISYNVQSLRKHSTTILNDNVFQESNVLLLQKTWISSNETIHLRDKCEIQRNAITGRSLARGTIIFSKTNFTEISAFKTLTFENMEQRIDITSCRIYDVLFINIYKNPTSTFSFFCTSMYSIQDWFNNSNIVFCGDFNETFQKEENIIRFLKQKFDLEIVSKLEPTTDAGTTIDAVFCKLNHNDYNIETNIYESYASFHKPLAIRLQRRFVPQESQSPIYPDHSTSPELILPLLPADEETDIKKWYADISVSKYSGVTYVSFKEKRDIYEKLCSVHENPNFDYSQFDPENFGYPLARIEKNGEIIFDKEDEFLKMA